MLKQFQTKKLHYGKYLYKIKIGTPISHIFQKNRQRDNELSFAKSMIDRYRDDCNNTKRKISNKKIDFKITKNVVNDAEVVYNNLIDSSDYIVRCEFMHLMIYTNSESLIDSISSSLSTERYDIWKPDVNTINLLKNSSNLIISNKKVDFPYKLTFGKKRSKSELGKWITKNKDKVKAGSTILLNLLSDNRYINGQYIYVKDEKVLLLIQMMIGDNISRIDKIIYKEDIDK